MPRTVVEVLCEEHLTFTPGLFYLLNSTTRPLFHCKLCHLSDGLFVRTEISGLVLTGFCL